MFEVEILIGDTEKRIVVQTRLGRNIENIIEAEPGEREKRMYADFRRRFEKRFGPNWTNRKPACGGYNCFGMLFASRRTSIFEDSEVEKILEDDGYRPIQEAEATVGDLALYRDQQSRGLLHVAEIVHQDELGGLHAVSKWDSTKGEDRHHIHHHMFDDNFDVALEFWTERTR